MVVKRILDVLEGADDIKPKLQGLNVRLTASVVNEVVKKLPASHVRKPNDNCLFKIPPLSMQAHG